MLDNEDWSEINSKPNCEEMFNYFLGKFLPCYNLSCSNQHKLIQKSETKKLLWYNLNSQFNYKLQEPFLMVCHVYKNYLQI